MEGTSEQRQICERFSVPFVASSLDLKAGVARTVLTSAKPLNGLRHPPVAGTTGWYIWAGEVFSDAADFFVPLHVAHLVEWCPGALPYLGLPPGWRFLVADGQEDIWFAPTLLDVT